MHPVFNPLHSFDICFLPCICLWQISLIQTCFRVVVGPGLVTTLPDFMPTCLKKKGIGRPLVGEGGVHTICIMFIANYIKGHKAYTPYINHTSSQWLFKTGVPQGGVFSPTLFNIYTADIPSPRAPVQVMTYADDITITSTHTSTSAANKYIQPYLHKGIA